MISSRWYWWLLGLSFLSSAAQGQVLHVVSANCEISNLIEIYCLPPVDLRDCNPYAISVASAEQITTVLPDSAYIHESVLAELVHGAVVVPGQAALAHSDASIVFRVDVGRQYKYALDVYLGTETNGGGTAIASFSLTRIGSGGGVIQSVRAQSGPGLPLEAHGEWPSSGILEAGDYRIEAHSSADGHPGGVPIGELYMWLKLRDVTAVAPATWGLVKSLYRTSP